MHKPARVLGRVNYRIIDEHAKDGSADSADFADHVQICFSSVPHLQETSLQMIKAVASATD